MARVRFLDQVPVGFYDTNNGGGTGAGFPYSGSAIITGSLLISGSGLTVTGSINADNITGSLFGTASWAINALTTSNTISSSFASTASYLNPGTYNITSSWAISTSNAVSSSFAQNAYSSQNTQDVLVNVLNNSGNNINKGTVVRITGSNNSSDIPRIVTASYENDNNSANTLGITNQLIAQGATGSVITEGILLGIDTNNFISGQLIYLGATGSIIGYAPQAPLHAVRLGEVIRSQQNNGSIYVRIDNGYELSELHDVLITSPSSSGDLLILSGSVWTNSKILTGSYILSGSLTTNDGVQVQSLTASFISASQITGSLFGTASWAQNALNADFAATAGEADSAITAQTASFLPVGTYAITASWAQSASNAITSQTASFILTASTNAFVQGGNSFGIATVMLGNNDNNNLAIETSGNTRLFIDRGGNIGIGSGNTTPSQTLYIQGSSAASGDAFAVANSTPTTLFTIQNAGNVGIGTNNPGAKLSITGSNTDTLFQVTSPTNNAILFVSGSSRVGMRMSNPSYDFHIAGIGLNSTVTTAIGVGNTGSGILRIERSSGGVGIIIQGTDGTVVGAGGAPVWEPYRYATADHNFNIGSSTLGSFNWYFGTNATLNNNTRLMQLSRQGNLGIGVFDLALTGSNPRFYISGSASQPLLIASSPTGTALFVSGSGNVGIGTNTPQATLHISGAISGSILEPTSSGVPTFTGRNGQFVFGTNAGNHFIYVWMAGAWRSSSLF